MGLVFLVGWMVWGEVGGFELYFQEGNTNFVSIKIWARSVFLKNT